MALLSEHEYERSTRRHCANMIPWICMICAVHSKYHFWSKVIFVLDGLSGAVQEVIFLCKDEEVPGNLHLWWRVISFPFNQKWYLLWTAQIIQIQEIMFAQCRLVLLSYSCSDNGAIQGRVSLQHGLSLHTAYNQSRIAGSRGFKNIGFRKTLSLVWVILLTSVQRIYWSHGPLWRILWHPHF